MQELLTAFSDIPTSIGGLFLTALGTSNQVERLFLVPGRGPSKGVVQRLALLNMPQNLRDQQRLLNTGNHPQRAAAIRTGLDANGEHALEALHLRLWLRMSRAASRPELFRQAVSATAPN